MTDVSATLSLFFPEGRIVPEADFPGLDRTLLRRLDRQEAILDLRVGDVVIAFGEDLDYIVGGLCTDVPAALAGDGEVIFDSFANPLLTRFTRKGDIVTVAQDYAAPVDAPAEPLRAALRGVAERFPAMLVSLWPDTSADLVQAYADAAKPLPEG